MRDALICLKALAMFTVTFLSIATVTTLIIKVCMEVM